MPYRGSMRIVNRRLLAGCATALVATFALVGCVSTPAPTPSTSAPTDAPVFASDEDALAAATEAYAAYLKVSDASWTDERTTRDDFLALSTGQAHDEDLSASELFDENGWRKVGTTTFDSIRLQSSGPNLGGNWEVRTYLCIDVSESDVIDVTGQSVATPDRPLRLPLEVAFVSTSSTNKNLLVSESQVWSGSNFC